MITFAERLPASVFRTAQIREIERRAIEEYGISGYELMSRAGAAAWQVILRHWPEARAIAVVCGPGNNGGDGLVVARFAHLAGFRVQALLASGAERFGGAAAQAYEAAQAAGVPIAPFDASTLAAADVIVDALLGIGLARPVEGELRTVIEAINSAQAPRLAIDVPSGLDADTGLASPVAVDAIVTITFLGLKQGLYLGNAAECCGDVELATLDVPGEAQMGLTPALSRLVFDELKQALPRRPRSAHKGSFGRLLLVGGGPGMGGAIRLAAEAALRVGAGLVYVATHRENVATVLAGRPEIICRPVASDSDFGDWLSSVDGVVVGPGLGRSAWAYALWRQAVRTDRPLVLDADGLNWLADEPLERARWVLTPHPGEAGRLLGSSSARVQGDRLAAVRALVARYGSTVVLKGAHTLVATPQPGTPPAVCDHGNPGMATGGTGDVLAGAIGGLLVQLRDLERAARVGVLLHALAGDAAAVVGERGTVAGDLLPQLRIWANPN